MIFNKKVGQSCSLWLGLSILLVACEPQAEELESSKTVTVLGVVTAEQAEQLQQALAPFTEETGIEVKYEGTDGFATVLPIRVDGGNPPDIAMFPQPGLMADFAREGKLVPIDSFIDQEKLAEAYAPYWIDLGTIDDKLYGIWLRASVKSLVWYSPAAFESAGYEVPTTWDEMIALSDQIVADGGVPWCLGIESGDATGWVGTDWVEDIMLRTVEPETYDQWVTNQIPFNASAVKNAFEQFGTIVLNSDYVVGGTVGAISTPFGDSPKPLFDEPPGCYMHRQANFIAAFFPEAVDLDQDVSIFPLPGIKPELGVPILVAGDVFAMFNDTPEARKLMEYLATVKPHEIWATYQGYISPHQQVSLDLYPNEISKRQAEILNQAEVIRFDASDMMPGAVGTGVFWTGVVDYVGGTDVDTVLNNIEESWPQDD